MIQSFRIRVYGDWTCPAKTIAIFAHDTEFSYKQGEMPKHVERVSTECKTIQDVTRLIKDGCLPHAISGHGERIDLKKQLQEEKILAQNGCEIVFFDTKRKNANSIVRPLAWVSFYRHENARARPIEIVLPRSVSTKFVTVAFIESENYLEGIELMMHPRPNVDCQSIIFSGQKLNIPH